MRTEDKGNPASCWNAGKGRIADAVWIDSLPVVEKSKLNLFKRNPEAAMRLPVHTATIVGKAILVLALVSTSNFVFASQEHKSESKPAEHTSKPNHSSNQSHTNNQNHNHPANHPSSTGHASGNRPSGAGQESRPSPERPSGNRPASPAGNRGGENPARGGNTGGNRSVAMDRGNTASHALPGRTVSLRGGGSASVRP